MSIFYTDKKKRVLEPGTVESVSSGTARVKIRNGRSVTVVVDAGMASRITVGTGVIIGFIGESRTEAYVISAGIDVGDINHSITTI